MNRLGLVFDATDDTPEAEADTRETPRTQADTTLVQTVTGLAEIDSETDPIDGCSLESCGEQATRWVVFNHAAVFTAFCSRHAPPSPWWTPEGGDRLNPTAEGPHPAAGHPDRSAGAQV